MPAPRAASVSFAVAALLIVLALGWYFYGQPSFRKGDVATPTTADQNSIAVLPFANISGKADQDYFSDGMTEELLERAGQGAAAQGRGAHFGLSVQRQRRRYPRDRPQARRHATLSKAACAAMARRCGSPHSWSASPMASIFGRKPTIANWRSVFALQDEIAQRIGAALKLSLGVSAPVAARAPIDPEAYDEYLKGRALLRATQRPAIRDRAFEGGGREGAGVCGGLVVALAHL